MPLPRSLARLNRRFTNRVARPLAGRIPPFATIAHIGRTSGTAYRTPIMVFRRPDGFLIALTYGEKADWTRNVLAAGAAELELGGKRYAISDPRISQDPSLLQTLPLPVRTILRLIGCDEFLIVRTP